MDLFDHGAQRDLTGVPLADRMRPKRLEDVVGQGHLLAEGKLLQAAIVNDRTPSMILWGPPGSGKTTLAQVIARRTEAHFVTLSAVLSGVKELREAVAEATERKRVYAKRTLLFVDEIHRFNKSQQDALLPHVESGRIRLIGATTENPSFAINAALLSRARVFQLQALHSDDLLLLLQRALQDAERGLGGLGLSVDAGALARIAERCEGDARRALDVLEAAAHHAAQEGTALTAETVDEALATRTLVHDKAGEGHYNVVSAFIKSMRGSDPDAALYWMLRMLEAGEDPLFVSRRMLIFASEDVGNADPRALELAVAADHALQRLGMPEALHSLAQCCTYLASTAKSNASYVAWMRAQADVRAHGALAVPLKLRNAVTRPMREAGYGEGYRYPHDEGGVTYGEQYLPDALRGQRYYEPRAAGFEARIAERLKRIRGEDPDGAPE